MIQSILRDGSRVVEKLLTRTQVIGTENIPPHGPVIFAANHASTFDSLLYINHLPEEVKMVGPGDFELLWPANVFVKAFDLILVRRGSADHQSLRQMVKVLKAGNKLALFPEGGTWEKRPEDVKSGAAYLSLVTGAPIIPIAIGGTYQVWHKIVRLRRPQITFHIGPPLPPVKNVHRKQRREILRETSLNLMRVIHAQLPPEDRARYHLAAHQYFTGRLDLLPDIPGIPVKHEFSVLAELISKPNLFSPLHRNANLPLSPLVKPGRFYPARVFQNAALAMLDAFNGPFENYLSYRLGHRKARQILVELEDLLAIANQAVKANSKMRFTPRVTILRQ